MKMTVKTGATVIITVLSVVLAVQCQNNRLSTATYPIQYNIMLSTQMNYSINRFDGTAEIRIGVRNATNEIVLNSNLIKNRIAIFEIDGDQENPIQFTDVASYPLLLLRFQQMLVVGTVYIIKIDYVGSHQHVGFANSLRSDDGLTVLIQKSNFVPQYPSNVFPCYDEPTFRAKFTLTIEHPIGHHAISNMAVLVTKPSNATGMVTTTFDTTSEISVHTLGFAVVHNTFTSNCINEGIKICAFYDSNHTPGDVDLVLKTAKDAIDEINNYINVTLDLPKLDIIPIDQSYQFDMFGSYGILNNNDRYYYYNSTTSGLVHKEELVRNTIRQVVILYLGNMLVAEWWDDIWLTKGLSVLFEYLIADKLYPEFDEINQFLSKLYESGFRDEAIKSVDSDTPVSLVLDTSTEYKSAGILYMLKNIVGENIFKKGLNNILSGSPLINSVKFFNIFTQLAIEGNMLPTNYNLNTIMNTWLTQLRFPLVSISRVPNTSVSIYQTDIINISEQGASVTNWWIPYTCYSQFDSDTISTEITKSKWLENISKQIVDHGFGSKLDNNSWIMCNLKQSGFYYVDYDPNNYKLLVDQLYSNHTKISALSRAQLVQMGFISALNNRHSLSLIFQLSRYIQREYTFTPVYTFIKEFMSFTSKVYGTEPYENVTKFASHIIGPAYDRVRLTQTETETNNLSFNDVKLREPIVFIACLVGYQNYLKDTNKLLNDRIVDNSVISLSEPGLGAYILHFGMVMADENLFWKMVALGSQHYELNLPLGFVRNSKLIDEVLTIFKTPNGSKVNGISINLSDYDRIYMLGNMATYNLAALVKLFDYMIENSDVLKVLLEDNYRNTVHYLAESTKTVERLEKFRQIVELYKTASQNYTTTLKTVEQDVEWCSKRIPEFQSTLSAILEDIEDGENNDGGGAASESVSMLLFISLIFCGQLMFEFIHS